MTTLSRTFAVSPPPPVVVPYLAGSGHALDWDLSTTRCVHDDTGKQLREVLNGLVGGR